MKLGHLYTALVCFISALNAGCATQAEQTATHVSAILQGATSDYIQCVHAVSAMPEYERLAPYTLPDGATMATVPQHFVANPKKPSKAERGMIAGRSELVRTNCRPALLSATAETSQDLHRTFRQYFESIDTINNAMVAGKLTWGAYNQRHLSNEDYYEARFAEVRDAFNANLAASHQAELQARVNALQAASQQMRQNVYQQQILQNQQILYNQQMMQQMTPRQTNCQRGYNGSFHCTTF